MKKYKWNAQEYSQFSSSQQLWARETIAKLNLHPKEHILDIGCGDGKVTAEIALQVPNGSVTGVDNSESMIELAQIKYPSKIYFNLTFQLVDAKNLNFNEQFDAVVSNAALHWVDDHVKVLTGIYKSLIPGGRLLLQMGGKGNVEEVITVFNEMITLPEWKEYFSGVKFPYYFFSVNEYQDFVSHAGFKSANIKLVEKDMKHEGEEGMKGWIKTTWLPYTQRVPEKDRNNFINEAFKLYAKKFPADSDGTFHVTAKRLLVEARK